MTIVLRKLIYKGSTNVTSLEHEIEWESIKFKRFKVQHRKSVMGAPPFGESFSLSNNTRTIFVTGGTILDSSLEHALIRTNPDFIVTNTSEYSFSHNAPCSTTRNL